MNKESKFEILLASVPDRDDIVAEIWCGVNLMAELSKSKSGSINIQLFPAVGKPFWEFELEEFIFTINEAAKSLNG